MSVINNGILLGAGADAATTYQISRSLRFNSADSAYLSRTPGSAGNRKTWTLAFWIKRSGLGRYTFFSAGSTLNASFACEFDSSDRLWIYNYTSGFDWQLISTSVYRDPSAWYHITIAVDTTQSTASNRVRVYVNGTEVTTFSTATYPSSSADTYVNTAAIHTLGCYQNQTLFANLYLADVHFCDGNAYTPSSFTETDATTGQLVPKTFSGSYGTNGFRLPFSDNSGTTSTTLGKDAAGSNNWTPNNFSVASGAGNDSLVDSPTGYGTDTGAGNEVRGNYACWNPIANSTTASQPALSNGNLDVGANSTGGVRLATIPVSSGKWYWEVTVTTVGNALVGAQSVTLTGSQPGYGSNSAAYLSDGRVKNNGSDVGTYTAFSANDIIGVALDMDNFTIKFYRNNTLIVTISSNISGTWVPVVADWNAGSSVLVGNFGQRPFAYTAPSGFKALCSHNLPEPTILQGNTAMDVKLYTGNGSTQTISGLGFSPDFVWLKKRSGLADHYLYDQVRGATYRLYSNTTDAESTSSTGLTAFTSDGFSLGSANDVNQSSNTYAAWCWDCGSSTVTNTSGSISSQVRASATNGCSVVTYTGTGANATVGHGLGVAPSMIIVKNRNGTFAWRVYHASLANTQVLYLSAPDAATTETTAWNSTSPTSSVFSLGTGNGVNGSSNTYVAYCFAPVAGFSAFGQYTGNGSSDGPFVFTGFRPRYILVKASSTGGSFYYWWIYDAVRSTYNAAANELYANTSDAEGIGYEFDLLSNGFKVRTNAIYLNNSGVTFIYAAFAESPFKYSRAR
jgi:hypothetical protein